MVGFAAALQLFSLVGFLPAASNNPLHSSNSLLAPAHADSTPTAGTGTPPTQLSPNPLYVNQPIVETGSVFGSTPIVPYVFPALNGELLPDNIFPSADDAAKDTPEPYQDRCHVQQNLTTTKASCIYGNPNSKTTIVLFGDSHALSWFPAIEQIAINKNWKLVSLTMSSCWPSSIPAWNSVTGILMKNCAIWRAATLKKIATLHPYITFVAGTRGFETIDSKGHVLKGDARTAAWTQGMNTTLTQLHQASRNLVYLSDYPVSLFAPEDCLALAPAVTDVCATSVAEAINVNWLNTERVVALSNGAIWINPTEWICSTDPCSPLKDDFIIYRDGGHFTETFARTLVNPLWSTLYTNLLDPLPSTSTLTTKTVSAKTPSKTPGTVTAKKTTAKPAQKVKVGLGGL